jgi:endonuclease I
MNKILLSLAVLTVFTSASAQISITDVSIPYVQDFNTLASTGTASTMPAGWSFSESGTNANTTYTADNGGLNAGNTYSYGTTGSTERALGSIRSGSLASMFGTGFTNNSTSTITTITINYTGELWRLGVAGRTDRLDFQYSLSATNISTGTFTDENNLDLVTPNTTGTAGAIDGNLPVNRASKSFSIVGLNLAPGSTIWIRWADADVTGIDDGLAIDDVTVSFNGTIVPACTEPTAQPTNLILSSTPTTITGNFTAASPSVDQYLVVRSTSATLSASPDDATTYSVGAAFGGGVVIAASDATTFTDASLAANTTYYYFIFAYNSENCSGGPNYLSTNPLTANVTTQPLPACTAPTCPATNLVLTASNSAITGNFTAAPGANRYLVVRSSDNTPSFTPANGTTYIAGQVFGNDTVVSYNNSTSFLAGGLRPNSTYYFFVYAAAGDCSGEPLYHGTALSGSQTTTSAAGLPANYYSSATGLNCQALKTQLKTIISTNHTALSYSGVWQAFQYTDLKRNDANTANVIWDMYSDNPTGPDPYTYTLFTNQCGNYNSEADCYNREHSFPQSWFSEASPMVSDLHHVFATDGYVNNIRGNFPFGEVASPTVTTMNGSKRGANSFPGYTGTVFEPINEYKGDLARAQLYMAVRYEDQINNWWSNGNANEVLLSPTDQPDAAKRKLQVFDTWHLQLLFKWHNQDPVSTKEIDRNNAIYYSVVNDNGVNKTQGNRNPFIDRPEYASLIFQCTGVVPVTLVDFNGSPVNNSVLLKWYATYETNFDKFIVERSTDGVNFIPVGEVRGSNLANYHFVDDNLPGKSILYYRLQLVDKDGRREVSRAISVRLNHSITSVAVFPNPTSGPLTISLQRELNSSAQIEIVDITGRRMINRTVPAGTIRFSVDVRNLVSGQYFLKIFNADENIRQSFMLVK